MGKRKFLILCLLLVLLSIAGVGASDADNITVQASTDTSNGDIVSDVAVHAGNDTLDDVVGADEEDGQNKLAVSDDENTVLGLAFKDLQKLVDDTPEGGELSLDYDYYVASGGHAIHISKSITINGNNHYLDACKDGRIIIIEADGKSVVFKNIKFVNGLTGVDHGNGGAIRNDYARTVLTFENCTFENNKANAGWAELIYVYDHGGAIYCMGNCNIFNCSFNNNNANGGGAAIYCEGKCNIKSSSFNGHLAQYGGAIYCKEELTIVNSTFGNNEITSMVSYGGAIYCEGNCNIFNSSFKENKAKTDGGAIYCEGNCNIFNSTFEKNNAGNDLVRNFGGAIRSKGLVSVDQCTFKSNYAVNQGGAIYADREIKIKNSCFDDNSAKMAGAVYADTINEEVSNSVFTNNGASSGDGGAIYINSKCDPKFQYCTFENNHADGKGGAIYAKTINRGGVRYSVLINNNAHYGGAIYIENDCLPEFDNCRFERNNAACGGAIYVDSSSAQLSASYCTFVDNHAATGQIIYNSGSYLLIDPCWFGTNNPHFKNQLTEHHSFSGDDDSYVPQNYLKIGIKILEEGAHYFIGNNYEVTVYFYDYYAKNYVFLHSPVHFYGNANFTNLKDNNMTADVLITKENTIIVGELDHQNVTLNLTASNKPPSYITIKSFSIKNGNGIRGLCAIIPLPDPIDSPYYVIMNGEGDIVRRGDIYYFEDEFYFLADFLPVGSYSVTVINPEASWYLASNETRPFKIIGNVSANITADNVVYGNATTITLKADYDGLYNVSINDLVIEMEVTNGSCTKQVKLNAGEYKTHTIFATSEDYVELSCSEASFNVSKATPLFNLNVSSNEFSYGDVVLVSHILPSDATGNISYSLNKKKYANLSVNDSLKLLDAGSYLIDATYSGDTNYYHADDSITIKINPAKNKATVSATNVTYGEDTVISISADVDGVYAVDVNGTIYNVTVNNGVGNRAIALNAGSYYANATFNNKNYNTTYKNAVFSVYKADVELNITVLDEVYPQDVEGVVHASRDGKYNLTIGDYKEVIVVKDGVCYFNIGTLDAGSYEAIVSLNDDNYNPVSNRTKFVVNASGTLFEIEVNVSEITYGESVTVTHTINDGATGNITYLLGDGTLLGVLPVGKNLTLHVLPAGSYVITADYSGDGDFIPASDIAFFTINKATNNIVITADNVTYGESTIIEVSADVDGVYAVDVNGTVYNITVGNGVGNKSISLNAGSYYANTSFNDDNYVPKIRNAVFNVNKALNNVVVTADNVTYGENITINVSADVDGVYPVDINGTVYNITVNNGIGNNSIALNAGSYCANATFNNKNYNSISKNAVFSVDKADTMLSVYVPTTVYLQDVVGVVYSSVDGEYNVTIGDYSTTVIVENVFGEFNAGILNAGEYILTATYSGDLNHKSNSTTASVYITKFVPNVTLNVSDVDCGEAAVITVTSDIYGSVNVTVDNMSVILDLDGTTKHLLAATLNAASDSEYKATLQLDNLNSGTYPVTAVYIGDDNIESIFLSSEFKVNTLNATINTDASDINIGDDETITVTLPDDATGTVTITVDSKNYTATVENGTASITIPDLTAGEKTAEIYYSGDGKYNPAEATATFTVNKIKADMTINANADSDGTTTIIVTLPDDATGTVTVTVDGKSYTAAVENGKATFNIPGLAPGKYEITANYSGDDKYDPIHGKSDVVVKDKGTKHENKTADNATPNKKVIKTTDKEMLKATGNPIFALLLTLMTIGITTIRRF
ncbi:Ig-like domain repeat protein [Methanobrevibacter sp.]|uniref:Ig-like domain repeat protein n=1 Tax=Methanobrevibacter sp. TaxID=66852 RepID=UPI00388E3C74